MAQQMDPIERQPDVGTEDDVEKPAEYVPDSSGMSDRRQDNAEDGTGQAREAVGNVATSARETTENLADRAREMAENVSASAREAEEQGRQEASSRLESVADQLRERAASDGTAGEMAEKAAATMERTAGYLREHSTGDMTADVESYVREHPMHGVAAAVVAGFIIGRVLR